MASLKRAYSEASSNVEMRRRIEALTGGVKPTREMVLGSIAPLLKKLKKEAEARRSHEAEFLRHLRQVGKSQARPVQANPADASAIKAFRAAMVRRAKSIKPKPPRFDPVPPQIKSGSIWTISIPPYDDRWASGPGSTANHLLGNWSTGCSGNNESLAGACVFFTPVPGRFLVRFAPFMPISFSYLISTYTSWYDWVFSRANSRGFLGAFVSAWDGRQWVDIADVRNVVWDRAVSIDDDASDGQDSAWWSPQVEFMTLGQPFTFALWAWGGVATSERDGEPSGFGFAQATMSASIPWLVIEQSV